MRKSVAGVLFVATTLHLSAQSSTSQPAGFDAVSIKPSKPRLGLATTRSVPGRFVASEMGVLELIARAFEVPGYRIIAPGWTKDTRFDIEATRPPGPLAPMLQRLLADRFMFSGHREQREGTVYRLTMANRDGKPGPSLRQMNECVNLPNQACGSYGTELSDHGTVVLTGRLQWSDPFLVRFISDGVGAPIRDETGLRGWFAIRLEWATTLTAASAALAPPSLADAVKEQLGLKLEGAREPVEYLVVDRVEKPAPN